MRCSGIKQNYGRGVIDRKRTKYDVRGFLSFLQSNMVDTGTGVVLLPRACSTTSSIVGRRGWGLVVVVGVLTRLWAVVSKVPLLSTVEAPAVVGLIGVEVTPIALSCLLTIAGCLIVVLALRGVEVLPIILRPLLRTLLRLLGLLLLLIALLLLLVTRLLLIGLCNSLLLLLSIAEGLSIGRRPKASLLRAPSSRLLLTLLPLAVHDTAAFLQYESRIYNLLEVLIAAPFH